MQAYRCVHTMIAANVQNQKLIVSWCKQITIICIYLMNIASVERCINICGLQITTDFTDIGRSGQLKFCGDIRTLNPPSVTHVTRIRTMIPIHNTVKGSDIRCTSDFSSRLLAFVGAYCTYLERGPWGPSNISRVAILFTTAPIGANGTNEYSKYYR